MEQKIQIKPYTPMTIYRLPKAFEIVKYMYLNSRDEKRLYSSKISYSLSVTYSHMVKLVDSLEYKGFIRREKQGRAKLLILTDKGKELAKMIVQFKEILGEDYVNTD